MREIYCKKVKNKETIEDYLLEYIKKDCPATYFKDTDAIQCPGGKYRSLNDLY